MSDNVNNGINSGIALRYLNYIEPYVREIEGQRKEIASLRNELSKFTREFDGGISINLQSFMEVTPEWIALKAQLKREQEAVDFYASTEAWNRSSCSDVAREICREDLDRVKGYAKYCGGKLARLTQTRREK